MLKRTLLLCLVLLAAACPAFCQTNADFGPNPGSDGAFAPAANVTVNLGAAPTAAWDAAGAGGGVYDAQKWAVVFKYSSVNIKSGVTVSFKNNVTTAPVVWLVSGNVTIDGVVNVSAIPSAIQGSFSVPGPGGFRGGVGYNNGRSSSGGFGIGGGSNRDSSAGFAVAGGSYAAAGASNTGIAGITYGNSQILPLIGGAGASGAADRGGDGGAGGGAILIVATGTITINGSIFANGGNAAFIDAGGGAGGAVRLIAPVVDGAGQIQGHAGFNVLSGGAGRIRLETNNYTGNLVSIPVASQALPDSPVKIWPDLSIPTVRVVSIGGTAGPADPHANLGAPDVPINSSAAQTVTLETTNVPPLGTVVVRVVPASGLAFTVNATFASGNVAKATWTASITFPPNYSALQARAALP